MAMKVFLKDLKPGDYIIPAKATVKETDCFASVIIIDFTDATATIPLPQNATVMIERQ